MRTAIALCAVLALAGVASAEFITGGDFESAPIINDVDGAGGSTYTAGTQSNGVWYGGVKWTVQAGGPAGSTMYADEGGWSDMKLMQSFATPAVGTVLTISGDYIASASYQKRIHVVGLTDGETVGLFGGGSIGGVELAQEGLSTASDWSSFSFDATVDAAYDEVAVVFVISGDGGVRGVDNVSVVPEPATMSLLGLGALALIRRRR